MYSKTTPPNPKALILLGEGFWQKGDTVKAIQHMEEVVETIPEEAATWLALAQIWQENEQTDKTMEVLQKGVVAIPDSPELLRELGKVMLEKQSPADAISYLKKAHDLDSHNPEASSTWHGPATSWGVTMRPGRCLNPISLIMSRNLLWLSSWAMSFWP